LYPCLSAIFNYLDGENMKVMAKIREKINKNYKQTKRRLTWVLYRRKRIFNKNPSEFIKNRLKDGNVKLHFCCGDKKYSGYINIDIVPLEGTDILMDIPQDLFLIPSNVASEILIECGFEHFYRYQQDDFLKECYRMLVKKGKLIMRCIPDFDGIIDAYVNKKPGNVSKIFDLNEVYRLTHGEPEPRNSPHQLHKDIFTRDSLNKLLTQNEFKIDKIWNEICPGENRVGFLSAVAFK